MLRPDSLLLRAGCIALACTFPGLLAGCPSLPEAYCQTMADCDDADGIFDSVGESSDSVGVCVVNQQTNLDALRANEEDVCVELALATEAYMACAVEEGCDAFRPFEQECSGEREDFFELIQEAGNRCNE